MKSLRKIADSATNLDLPGKIPGVYFLLSEGEIVYAGQSRDIVKRCIYHRSSGVKFDSLRYIAIADDKERLAFESKFIKELQPRYNKQGTEYGANPGEAGQARYKALRDVASDCDGAEEILQLPLAARYKVSLIANGVTTKQQLLSMPIEEVIALPFIGEGIIPQIDKIRLDSMPIESSC
jgi:hypothetical protein